MSPLLPLVCFLDEDVEAAIEWAGLQVETREMVEFTKKAPGAVFESVFIVDPIPPDSMTLAMLADGFSDAIVDIRGDLRQWNEKKIKVRRSATFDNYQRHRQPTRFVCDQYFI
jgi:hypothetical protein